VDFRNHSKDVNIKGLPGIIEHFPVKGHIQGR